MAFGDLFLEDIRRYREERMRDTGIAPLFPLWGRPTRALAEEMLASGLGPASRASTRESLPASFAGREFDRGCSRDLPAGVDPCGENGEFHTFAWDGPMFRKPVAMRAGEVVDARRLRVRRSAAGRGRRMRLPAASRSQHWLAAATRRWPTTPPARRVASINLSADEVLVEILPPERLVGVTRWVDEPETPTRSAASGRRCSASRRPTWRSWSRSRPTW